MKTCFKCGVIKPLEEFYTHPMMKDGHLNKCKSCTRNDTALNHKKKSHDPLWVISELKRHREKSERARKTGKATKPSREASQKWALQNPFKIKAHKLLKQAISSGKVIKKPCYLCGKIKSEGHHEDYSKPLDVIWLCRQHHGLIHHIKNIMALYPAGRISNKDPKKATTFHWPRLA